MFMYVPIIIISHLPHCTKYGEESNENLKIAARIIYKYRVIYKSIKHVRKLADATVE